MEYYTNKNIKWTFCFRGEDPEDVGVALGHPGYSEKNGHVVGNGMSNPSYNADPNDYTDNANTKI